jgi:hypothetical protein
MTSWALQREEYAPAFDRLLTLLPHEKGFK